MPDELAKTEVPIEEAALTTFEQAALTAHRQKKHPSLSPAKQAELFELFLVGTSCEEISKLNPGISLGDVLAARFEFGWDAQRQRHIDDLLANARSRVQQTQLEAIEYLRMQLAVFHKAFNEKAKKFIQTGKKADMPNYEDFPWGRYKQELELLVKLTGTAPPERQLVEHNHEHHVTVAGPSVATTAVTVLPGGMDAKTAADAIKAFEQGKPD